jgi:signal transduction histidine kinase
MKKLFSHGYFRSIGFKIAFIIICVGIIPFVVCVPISMRAYESVSIRTDATNLMAQAISYNSQIVTSGYLTGDDNSLLDTQLKAVAESYNGRILVVNSALKIVRDSFSADVGKPVIWENIIYSMQGESLYYYDKLTNYLIVTVPLTSSEGETVGVLVINKSMDYILTNEDTFLSYMLIGEIIIVSLTLIVAVLSHIHFTKPMKRMSKSLDAIVREYTSEMPEEDSFTELHDISSKFNEVIGKLHSIDESRQEFVSNVSHELKTPLTSMKVLADSLNGSEDVPIEMYKEFMLDIGDEIDRETKIINDLLSLVRMDKSGAQLNVTAVNINELIEHILKRLKPIAEKSDIEVVYESFRPVVAEVDEVKFTLVITNLVENAIK